MNAFFYRNIGGIPPGPPSVLIFSRLIARSINNEVNVIISNLLSTFRSLVDRMVPLLSVNLLVKTLCSENTMFFSLCSVIVISAY